MRITKEEVVAGHSALRVRGFLRRFERGFFMLSAAERLYATQIGAERRSLSTIWSRSNSLSPQCPLGIKRPSRLQREVMHLRMQLLRSQFLEEQQNGS